MLVLSRKEGERIMVGDDVVLTVNRISGNRVAIGIEAPRSTSILRGELSKSESDVRGEGGKRSLAQQTSASGMTTAMGHGSFSIASKPST